MTKFIVSEEQHEILLGIMLGDGHLQLSPNGKSVRLLIEQSEEKRVYVEHLYSIFLSWNPGVIRFRERKKENKVTYAWTFFTKYSESLLPYHKKFYLGKVRLLPREIESEFTARSFAYLYMDDGGIKSKESKGVYLNTYKSLTEKDQHSFSAFLVKKFHLQAKVVFDRQDPRIYISGYSYGTLVALLKPYILPFFSYKIPPPRSEKSRFNN